MGSEMQPQIKRAQKSEQNFILKLIKTTDMLCCFQSFGFIHVHSADTQHIFFLLKF
jgi:hypothetical protein